MHLRVISNSSARRGFFVQYSDARKILRFLREPSSLQLTGTGFNCLSRPTNNTPAESVYITRDTDNLIRFLEAMHHLSSPQASLLTKPDDPQPSNPESSRSPSDLVDNSFTRFSKALMLIPSGKSYSKREMCFTNYIPCGGPTFDPLLGNWSEYFVVDDDGTIPECGNKLNDLQTTFLTKTDVGHHSQALNNR